tara:strand:- start:78 stop:452 length:375 start_codon:yes stop_codon:yes gene_type:complete
MNNKRPISPHITVHKWILSQMMSITHRATGIGVFFGMLFISLWMLSISLGQTYYLLFELFFFNFLGKIILTVISFCFSFYFFEEIRKVFWIFGLGLNIKIMRITSYIIILSSLLITFFIFIILL